MVGQVRKYRPGINGGNAKVTGLSDEFIVNVSIATSGDNKKIVAVSNYGRVYTHVYSTWEKLPDINFKELNNE